MPDSTPPDEQPDSVGALVLFKIGYDFGLGYQAKFKYGVKESP